MADDVASFGVRRIWRAREGKLSTTPNTDEVAAEAPLELRIDGRPLTVVMRTPGHDEELVRGFLYSEGIISAADDLVSLERPSRLVGDEVGNVVDARLRPGSVRPPAERLFYASSSCGVCGKQTLSSLAVRAPLLPEGPIVSLAVVNAVPDRLRAEQPLFDRTGGLHAAGLFDSSGNLECVREDVGRHNALDKLIGWALTTGRLPLSAAGLVVSGRVGYEIVQKALAAGLPLIVAVGAPSSLAVELSEQFGLTLCGFVRHGGVNVYSHPERLSDSL
jgi:FdhD protein